MSGWRFYAQRAVAGGAWLANDLTLEADITEQLSGGGDIKAKIPAALDHNLAADGRPLWLERGTKLYAELDGQLRWVGVCDYNNAAPEGRSLEFVGLPGPLAWMPYEGEFRVWRPAAATIVKEMIDRVQSRPNGNLELILRVAGDNPPGLVGDPPPPPRPAKPGKRSGETAEDYDDRLLPWEEAVDAWDALYKTREPYTLAWYDAPMVGDELAQLAKATPFDYRMVHRWIDRDARTAEHVLEVGARLGTRRTDIRFTDGVNLAEKITPETDLDGYANDVIVLGSGEGPGMKRGRSTGPDDGRLWSAKIVSQKDVSNDARLQSLAEEERKASSVATKLSTATVWDLGQFAAVSTLRVGDEVWVESAYTNPPFGAWQRILTITRNTKTTHKATLTFETAEGS